MACQVRFEWRRTCSALKPPMAPDSVPPRHAFSMEIVCRPAIVYRLAGRPVPPKLVPPDATHLDATQHGDMRRPE